MRIRLKIYHDKCIQGVQHLAQRKPGISHYFVGKLFFFADRSHLIDWGRPISGDQYVAMEHGPVPITIFNMIKGSAGISNEVKMKFQARLRKKKQGNQVKLWSNMQVSEFPDLSGSDIEYLDNSMDKYGEMDFSQLKELSHSDLAYKNAIEKSGENSDINPIDWLGELGTPEQIVDALYEMSVVDRHFGVKYD